MPRLRSRFRAIQAWRSVDGAPAQPIHPAPAEETVYPSIQAGAMLAEAA